MHDITVVNEKLQAYIMHLLVIQVNSAVNVSH